MSVSSYVAAGIFTIEWSGLCIHLRCRYTIKNTDMVLLDLRGHRQRVVARLCSIQDRRLFHT